MPLRAKTIVIEIFGRAITKERAIKQGFKPKMEQSRLRAINLQEAIFIVAFWKIYWITKAEITKSLNLGLV